jgi:hypothetical protein
MRETPNIKLTQFEPNDVPNWLDQYNSDMLKVDTAVGEQKTENSKYELRFTADEELINNNRTQINENTQDIANVKDDIKNIKGGSTTSIAGLQTEVALVSQSLTTLKGGSDRTIAELETDLNTDKAEISALNGRVETLEDSVKKIGTNLADYKGVNIPNTVSENLIVTITIDNKNKEGHYFAHVNGYFEENENGIRQIVFKRTRNGETIDIGIANNRAVPTVKTNLNIATVPFDAKLNDVFSLYAMQTSNTTINVIGTMSLYRLRE